MQKKIQTVENELDQTQEALTLVTGKLEEKNKALQNVSRVFYFTYQTNYGKCGTYFCSTQVFFTGSGFLFRFILIAISGENIILKIT